MTTTPTPTEETDAAPDTDGYVVPEGVDHVTCVYCDAPFADEELLALHRGLEHESRLTDDEREAFEAAYETEAEAIRLFRLKAIAVLVVLYFSLLMTYSVFA